MGSVNAFIEQLYPSDEEILWEELRPYVEDGALFMLSPGQNLEHILQLIQLNEINEVENLIEEGKIYRPTLNQIQGWEERFDLLFKYLVIEPYIIVQEFSPPIH